MTPNEIMNDNVSIDSKGGKRLAVSDRKEALENAKFNKKLNKLNKKNIGFTNKLAIYLVLLLTLTLGLGFYLAIMSIKAQYTGALVCWSCVVGPLDACLGIVLVRVVDKSRAENVGPNGEGISYALAKAAQGDTSEIKYGASEAFKKAMEVATEANEEAVASSVVSEDEVWDSGEDMTDSTDEDELSLDNPTI